ncbi:O-antigen ligase family protein [Vibrio diazotrophicus]|uniref:O-antigen ligase family protein n=1 Tax=Vibrio diazotrophicus TaxID=685 RepID=UPI00142D33BE|nr:O-antigen ligase family protein [Vibrio diazotrophicus]NIY92969.1 O-antigen ligase family protein [Vibrio diazotrophicus]
MKITQNTFYLLSILLVPTLLLTTKNGSVAIVAITSLYSLFFLVKNYSTLQVNNFDKIVIGCLATYFLIYIPTAISDGSTLRYFQGGIRLLFCIPIYLALTQVFKDISKESVLKYLSIGVILGSIGALILAIYQHFILQMDRVDGFLYSINFGYLATALLCLSSSLTIFNRQLRPWLVLAVLSSCTATFLTFTRGAIFAIPLLIAFSYMVSWKHINWKMMLTVVVLLITTSIGTYTFSSSVKKRIDYTVKEFVNIKEGDLKAARSSGTRLYLWAAAIEAYKESPIIGLTYQEREALNKKLYNEGKVNDYVRDLPRGHAHSQYFEMLASSGSLSFIGIFMMLLLPMFIFVKHFWNTQSIWGFTGSVFVAGFILFGLTEAPLQANTISAFYGFMLATIFALIRNEKYNHKNDIN